MTALQHTPTVATLQPSTHARGVRPFEFHGRIDEWHAPGVTLSRGATRCAVDAAWLVERVLGAAARSPLHWPGVMGARERAIEYGGLMGLRKYQQEGAAFLAERDYALLADEVGIGKSAESLIAAEARLSLGSIPSATTPVVLVLAPALAKRHWQREVKKWTGHDAEVLDGLTPGALPETRYVIANYDILYGGQRKDAAGQLFKMQHLPGWAPTLAGRFLIAILDEAHLLRGRDSRRTKAVRELCKRVPVVWALTGTPMPNHVRDLWSLLDLISDGLFGSYWTFAKTHCEAHQAQYGWVDTGASNLDDLRSRLTFFTLGRTKASVGLELPEKTREIYKIDVETTAPTVAEGVAAKGRFGFVMSALRRTAKAKRSAVIAQTLEALEARQKVVVFVYMREQAEAIAAALKSKIDVPIMCVHGDLSPDGRDAQAQVFRECGSAAAFVATIDSVGIAISLVGADLGLFGDLVPEPHKLLQAEGRLHRFTSTSRVLIRYLIATGTLDEDVAESVVAKLDTVEQVIGEASDQTELKGKLGGRSTEEIVDDLFAKLMRRAEA